MGLNSGGEGLRLTDFKLSLQGMQGVTEKNSLNWLFGVSCMVFGLSSCVWGGSDSISGELIAVRSSVYIPLDRSWYLRLRVRVSNVDVILRRCGIQIEEDGRCGLEKFNNFSPFLWPDVSLRFGELFQGSNIVDLCRV